MEQKLVSYKEAVETRIAFLNVSISTLAKTRKRARVFIVLLILCITPASMFFIYEYIRQAQYNSSYYFLVAIYVFNIGVVIHSYKKHMNTKNRSLELEEEILEQIRKLEIDLAEENGKEVSA